MSSRSSRSRRPAATLLVALASGVASLLVAPRTDAHELGLSRSDLLTKGSGVEAVVAFARRDAIALLPAMDADRDGSLSDEEVTSHGEAFAKRVLEGFEVEADGKACTPKPGSARLASEDGIDAFGSFACGGPTDTAALTVRIPLLAELSTGHRQLLKISHGGKVDEAMLHSKEPSLSLKGEPAKEGSDPAPAEPEHHGTLDFFPLGIEHILTGWDHLVFLVGLALVAGFGERRARSIFLAVTAFTVAHSVTLAMAVLGLVRPSPSIIEPLIALSVAYVGIENFIVKDPGKRWRVTLPFGLIHGFGFAGALGHVGIPTDRVPAALLLFNLGVETGQLAVLALLLPLVFFLARQAFYRRWGMRALSGLIVLAGLFWFFERVLG